jgi:hypothetical protein
MIFLSSASRTIFGSFYWYLCRLLDRNPAVKSQKIRKLHWCPFVAQNTKVISKRECLVMYVNLYTAILREYAGSFTFGFLQKKNFIFNEVLMMLLKFVLMRQAKLYFLQLSTFNTIVQKKLQYKCTST